MTSKKDEKEKKALYELVSTYAPLPMTYRGFALNLGSGNSDWIAYGNGRTVVLRNLKDPSISDCAFTEHKGNVTVVKISPSGGWVCSGDDTGTVMVWGLKNKIVKNTVQINKKIYDLDWSSDNTKIVAVGDGNESKSKVFPFDSGNTVGVVEQHAKAVLSVSYKPTRPFRIATGSEDQTTNFYEGPPFKFVKQIEEHHVVNCVRFSPSGDHYAVVYHENITLYDGKDGKEVSTLKDEKNGHKGTILSVAWSADSKKLLSAGMDKTAKIWNVSSSSVETTFEMGNSKSSYLLQQVSALWFGSYMLSVSMNGALNYLDQKSPTTVHSIHGVQQPFSGYSFNKKTGHLYTADQGNNLTSWDTAKGSCVWWSSSNSHSKGIVGLAVSAKGTHLWSVSHDNTVKYNDLKENKYSTSSTALGSAPVALAAATSDDELAAVILSDKLLIIREEKIISTSEFKATATCLCWSLDDTTVSVGCSDGKIRSFEVEKDSATLKVTYEGQHVGKVVSVTYSPSGQLVSMGFDRMIYFWESKSKVLNQTGWPLHNASIVSSSFNPDGDLMATGSQDQNIIIWKDLKGLDGTKALKIELAHLEGVLFVAFLGNNTLLSLGLDKTIKTWKF